MSDTTWSTLPFLGLVPHFHADPVEDGPPVVSADGHWWWAGHEWVPLAESAPRLPKREQPTGQPTGQPAPAMAEAG